MTRQGLTALHIAFIKNDTHLIRLLLDAGASHDIQFTYDSEDNIAPGTTLLHYAVIQGNTDAVKMLLDRGAFADTQNRQGRSAVHLAAEIGSTPAIEALLDARASVDLKDDTGDTALHIATQAGHATTVQSLLVGGADIEARDREYNTSLLLAAKAGHASVVETLLNPPQCPDMIDRSEKSGPTVLRRLANDRGISTLFTIYRVPAFVDATDSNKRTPLLIAVDDGRLLVVEALLRQGASTGMCDTSDKMPMDLAMSKLHDCIRKLLSEVDRSSSVWETVIKTYKENVKASLSIVGVLHEYGAPGQHLPISDMSRVQKEHLISDMSLVQKVSTQYECIALLLHQLYTESQTLNRYHDETVRNELIKVQIWLKYFIDPIKNLDKVIELIPCIYQISDVERLHKAVLDHAETYYGGRDHRSRKLDLNISQSQLNNDMSALWTSLALPRD